MELLSLDLVNFTWFYNKHDTQWVPRRLLLTANGLVGLADGTFEVRFDKLYLVL